MRIGEWQGRAKISNKRTGERELDREVDREVEAWIGEELRSEGWIEK